MKKLLKIFGIILLCLFAAGMVMKFTGYDPKKKKAAAAASLTRSHFHKNFNRSFEVEGNRNKGEHLRLTLYFMDNGMAAVTPINPVGESFVDLYTYEPQDTLLMLTPLAHFATYEDVKVKGERMPPFRLTSDKPGAMTLTSLLSHRGKLLTGKCPDYEITHVEETAYNLDAPEYIKLMAQLFQPDFAPVGVSEGGVVATIHAPEEGGGIIDTREELMAYLMDNRVAGESFEMQGAKAEAHREWLQGAGKITNGLWAGNKTAIAFLPLALVLMVLAFMGTDERLTNYNARGFGRKVPLSGFNVVYLLFAVGSSAFLLWYVFSMGLGLFALFTSNFVYGLINAIIATWFLSALVGMIWGAEATVDWFCCLRKVRFGWLEGLVCYAISVALLAVAIQYLVSGEELFVHRWQIVCAYLTIVVATLPRTLVRVAHARRKLLALIYFLVCYPLRYPLFVIALIMKGIAEMIGNNVEYDPDDSLPDTMTTTDAYGNLITIRRERDGSFRDNRGRDWQPHVLRNLKESGDLRY